MLNLATHNRWARLASALFASFLLAFTINTFIAPLHLYSAGIYGAIQLLCSRFAPPALPLGLNLPGLIYLLVNIPLLLLANGVMGRTFVRRLVLCTVSNSVFLAVIPIPAVPIIEDTLTSCLVGGILAGFANGLALTCGASCGGLDILGLYFSKKRAGFTVGRVSIIFNAALYTVCMLLYDIPTGVYSAIYTVFNALVTDRVHKQNITVQVLIFTKQDISAIREFITRKLARGLTIWRGEGGYTGDDVSVLCVCLSKYEIEILQDSIRQIDPHAFFMALEGVQTGGNFKRHLQ